MTAPPPFWRPDIHADRRAGLLARGRIKAALRAWFEADGFVETECAILQASPGNEAHLHAFETSAIAPDGARETLYLHTSPEFAMKKLLAAGEPKLFEFARVFRNREGGPRHAREFVMLEWYRAGAPYADVIDDALALVAAAARAAGTDTLRHGATTADPFAPAERISVADAFAKHAGVALLDAVRADGSGDRDALATAANAIGVPPADDDDWSDLFAKILVARVEPKLGQGRLTVLDEYPAIEAALARPSAHDPRVAERFELYACGVELANGFGELTDAAEQRRRFEAEMDLKQARYGERYRLDEDFLAALACMPEASGVAMGFDRLVMLSLGAPKIADILWTP